MQNLDLNKLTRKNQEFIRIATNQLIHDGKNDEEIKKLLQSILPTILKNQSKGLTAKGVYGPPTSWASSQIVPNPKKEETENDTPILMWLDSVLLILGSFASLNSMIHFFSRQSTTYGITTISIMSIVGGTVFYIMYRYIYRPYENGSTKQPTFLHSLSIVTIVTFAWFLTFLATFLFPRFLNPILPASTLLIIGLTTLVFRFYLRHKLHIKSAIQSGYIRNS